MRLMNECEDNGDLFLMFDYFHVGDCRAHPVAIVRLGVDLIALLIMKNAVIIGDEQHLADDRLASPEGQQFIFC